MYINIIISSSSFHSAILTPTRYLFFVTHHKITLQLSTIKSRTIERTILQHFEQPSKLFHPALLISQVKKTEWEFKGG